MNAETITDCSVQGTVKDGCHVTMTVKFQRTITLPESLTPAQQIEIFTRLHQGGVNEILTGTMDWAVTGVEQ